LTAIIPFPDDLNVMFLFLAVSNMMCPSFITILGLRKSNSFWTFGTIENFLKYSLFYFILFT
jgi:hypothetical protein